MNIKVNTNFSRARLEEILQTEIKKSFRSMSLLKNSSEILKKPGNRRQASIIGVRSSFDLKDSKKPQKRTPPARSLNSFSAVTEEIKPIFIMSPSKVLLEHHEKLSQYEYKEIKNYPEVYFLGKTTKKFNGEFCDEKMYYRCFVGDHIAYRYEIQKLLGDGSFGIVVQGLDHKNNTEVAIKVLRKGKKFSGAGEAEARVLDLLNANEENDVIVEKLDSFHFRGHFCIVYELLSLNLYQYLKKGEFKGINMNIVKRISVQILIALKKVHACGLIHCDLKPENILFKAENKSSIKLIDFGSACEKNNKIYTYIQSRFYRAPEVLLDSGYCEKIDIWSLGCIIYELFKGEPIFQGANESDQLCKIVEVLGEIPQSLLETSKKKNIFFDENEKLKNFYTDIKSLPGLVKNADKNFIDFLLKCLKIDPSERISAEEALNHPWIRGNRLQNSRSLR